MQKLWLVVFSIVVVVALALLLAGIFGTEYKLYSRFGDGAAPYNASDPALIREFSFG
jgi:hypothetical protein